MVKDTFSIIPTIVLENELLSPADKLIFSVLFGFRLTQKCWASNNYISEKTKISIPTVNRSLKTLEKYGFISRVTTQEGMIKKREIVISEIEDIGINLSEAQNDTSHDQNDQTTNQNDHLSMIKMISTPNQNDQSIDNIINKVIDNTNNNTKKKTSKPLPKKNATEVIPTTPEDLILEPHLDTKEVRESLIEWLAYKKEKRQSYKPIGFKSFMKKTHEDYQDPITLIKSIENAMSKNWDGVYKIKDGLDRARKHLSRAEQNQEYLKASMARAKQLQEEGQAEIDAGIEQIGFFDNYNPLDVRK